jgi:hypothetical protein
MHSLSKVLPAKIALRVKLGLQLMKSNFDLDQLRIADYYPFGIFI